MILSRLNFIKECKKYSISLWQCPTFLFVLMGFIIILSILLSYFIASKYISDPLITALLTLSIAFVLMILGYSIVNGFEKLAEANRLKTEFVNIVAHQLRTPLSAIRWSVGFLLGGKATRLNSQQYEQIELIQSNVKRLIRLVDDLLDVSRVEQGRIVLKKEKIDLGELAKEMIEQYSSYARASDISLKLKAEKKLPLISADSEKIKIVLQNLIDNAIRYSKKSGKVQIKLSKENGYIKCEVKDNGVGIPKNEQKYIFRKFFRSSNILRRQTRGTGLGLFITKAFINLHNGRIGFKSEENKGSVFWFELPITPH